ncbi:hypothetical protein ACGFIF_43135 [Kribbella sp. NPDC049174]|uniref:hypothetical protein n=1 Tax=Kribbella sp. NPDC049174 TaxID=3364112 RepID=UPI00371EA8C9
MTNGPNNADIKLSGGPGDRQTFSREDWAGFILATQRMGRTTPAGAGWALGYERSAGISGQEIWVWTGVNCYPIDQIDPELLRPYGAFLHDPAYDLPPAAVPGAAA